MGWDWGYRPYVPVAQRRANAMREVRRLAGKGRQVSPVEIAGRTIASSFWGKAWCDHLESYSDFENRLPRGRTYVRNGSVVDLQIEPGKVTSMVSGSDIYRVSISIKPLAAPHWKQLKQRCGTEIGSLVELLQGRLSASVMAIVTNRDSGLFPKPAEIEMSCSCPDWAEMCKHVAATLYGVGSRLDHSPELLFKLRQVDHLELISQAVQPAAKRKGSGRKTIAKDQLADVFGIEMETDAGITPSAAVQPAKSKRNGRSAAVEGERNDGARPHTEPQAEPHAEPQKPRGKASPASDQAADSKRKKLSVKERRRAAETLKRRSEALRQRAQPKDKKPKDKNENLPSRSPKRTNGKAQGAQSASSKPARKRSGV